MKIKTITLISILNGMILLLFTLADFLGIIKYGMVFSYQWHKVLHLTGVVIFMGNMIAGPFWFLYAYYSRDKTLLKFASKLLQLTDIYLTIPGIALTVLNGLCLTAAYGGTRSLPWLFYSIILLFIMWALSIPLIYIQEKLYETIESEPDNVVKSDKLLTLWGIIGTVAMIPPSIIFYLMVAKGA